MKTEQRDDNHQALPAEEQSTRGSFRRVLKNRSFLLLWLAQLLSQIVFNAANYGVIAIVTAITHSASLVGVAIISFTLPAVPFSPLAGVYVDYLDKRTVLWVSNALRALATLLIVVALLWNSTTVIPLYILSFVISLVTQFFTPAEASAIPLLVGKNDLVPAISLFNITLTIAQALGFLVIGGLITSLFPPFHLSLGLLNLQVQSYDVLFVFVALVYIICTILILAMPANALHSHVTQQKLPRSLGKETWRIIGHDLKETWDYLRGDRELMLALLEVSFVSILLLVIGEVAGPFVVNVLHLPVQNMPLIFGPAGIGLVVGGAIMPYVTRWLGKRRAIMVGSISTALGLILIPIGRFTWLHIPLLPAGGVLFLVSGITFFLGIALDLINIPAQTVMQEHAPEEERGRIFSFQSTFYNAGSIPVLLFAGAIADILGIETVLFLLAASILLFRLWAARYSHRSFFS